MNDNFSMLGYDSSNVIYNFGTLIYMIMFYIALLITDTFVCLVKSENSK